MKAIPVFIAAVAALVALPAQAMLITDDKNFSVKLNEGQSHTVTHDLTGYGVPLSYQVTSANLKLGFSDGVLVGDLAVDLAGVSGPGLSGQFYVGGTHLFGYDIHWISVGQPGIDVLNAIGMLQVTIKALSTPWWQGHNDFWWKTSKLYAYVEPASVPEPATLGLLGLGLMAVGLSRKRRFSKQ